ncbi:MAG: alpha/beta fold hydrolase [Anaerolineales bacterium]
MPTVVSVKRGWNYYRNLLLFTLFLVILAVNVVLPAYDAYTATHPARFAIGAISPADLGLPFSEASFTTEDGLTLRGWYVPSTNGAAIILVHAFNGNRTGMLYHAALLAKHGYGVLLYDTRSQGESDGGLYAMGWDADRDVLAALDFLNNRTDVDPERIGVLGLSAGARIALYAAAETDRLAAVVAEGCGYPTFADWVSGARPADRIWAPSMWMTFNLVQAATGIWNPTPMHEAVSRISPTPVFLIAAGDDRPFNQVYFDAAREPKESWFREEAGHIDALFAHPKEYEEKLIGFFDRHLVQSPSPTGPG